MNVRTSSAGARLWQVSGCGAPIRWGTAISTAATFQRQPRVRPISATPIAESVAVTSHHAWRLSSAAASVPGSSGARPSAGSAKNAA